MSLAPEIKQVIAVDPGEKHVGIAVFKRQGRGWVINRLLVLEAQEALSWLEMRVPHCDALIIEEYRIFPGAQNTWSTGPTIEMIGVLKRVAYKAHVPVHMVKSATKAAARGLMRARGVMLQKADGVEAALQNHGEDAQGHGWRWLFKQGEGPFHTAAGT